MVREYDDVTISVSNAPRANKRMQVVLAIKNIPQSRKEAHKIIALADDDISFGQNTLRWMLAPFEDQVVAAVGTCQRARRIESGLVSERIINWLFADYLARRAFENKGTLGVDGSISCLSGRMGAYRCERLEDPEFQKVYVSETWKGHELNADDDNCVTREMQKKGSVVIQCHEECEVETSFGYDLSELRRFARWQRSNHRSNRKSLCDPEYRRNYPWGLYALVVTGFVNYGLLGDFGLWWLLLKATAMSEHRLGWILLFALWWPSAKIVKRIRLLLKNWKDLQFLPIVFLWGWCHDLVKLHAATTLHKTGW